MSYHAFKSLCHDCDGTGVHHSGHDTVAIKCRECEGSGYTEYGSLETFHKSPACEEHGGDAKHAHGSCHDCAMLSGWYWWPCFPGCPLPDDEPTGPFETEDAALADAWAAD